MEAYDRELNRLANEKEQNKCIDIEHEVKSDIARLTNQMSIEGLIKLKCAALEIVSK